MEEKLDNVLNNFIGVTAKSKVAVIVPLFGYDSGNKSSQLGKETLKATLDRIQTSVHQLYIIFVGDDARIPAPIANIIVGKAQAGNAKGVAVEGEKNYVNFVKTGIKFALEESDARFILVVNPWVVLQQNDIDVMVERINKGDSAKLISGYDLRGVVEPEVFDDYTNNVPKETRDITFNFFGMERFLLEMVELDGRFKTHTYVERDLWQQIFSKGFDVIVSERIPIYSFDLDWSELEPKELLEADRSLFIDKWHFDAL